MENSGRFVKSPLFVFYFLSSYDGPRTKVLNCYLYIVRSYFTPFAYPDCYYVKLWVGTLLFVVDFLTVRFNARSQDFVAQKRLLTEQV